MLYLLQSGFLLAENLLAEQQNVDCNKEYYDNAQSQIRLGRRCCGQQQNRETENHCREVLINQIVRNRCLEVAVDLSEQDDASTGSASQHAIHRQKLLLCIGREQFVRYEVDINVGYDHACNTHSQQHSPILSDDAHADGGDACGHHDVKEEIRGTGQQEVVGVVAMDQVVLLIAMQLFESK